VRAPLSSLLGGGGSRLAGAPEVDPAVRRFLVAKKLGKHCDRLAGMGVTTVKELLELCEDEDGADRLKDRKDGLCLSNFEAQAFLRTVTAANDPTSLKAQLAAAQEADEDVEGGGGGGGGGGGASVKAKATAKNRPSKKAFDTSSFSGLAARVGLGPKERLSAEGEVDPVTRKFLIKKKLGKHAARLAAMGVRSPEDLLALCQGAGAAKALQDRLEGLSMSTFESAAFIRLVTNPRDPDSIKSLEEFRVAAAARAAEEKEAAEAAAEKRSAWLEQRQAMKEKAAAAAEKAKASAEAALAAKSGGGTVEAAAAAEAQAEAEAHLEAKRAAAESARAQRGGGGGGGGGAGGGAGGADRCGECPPAKAAVVINYTAEEAAEEAARAARVAEAKRSREAELRKNLARSSAAAQMLSSGKAVGSGNAGRALSASLSARKFSSPGAASGRGGPSARPNSPRPASPRSISPRSARRKEEASGATWFAKEKPAGMGEAQWELEKRQHAVKERMAALHRAAGASHAKPGQRRSAGGGHDSRDEVKGGEDEEWVLPEGVQEDYVSIEDLIPKNSGADDVENGSAAAVAKVVKPLGKSWLGPQLSAADFVKRVSVLPYGVLGTSVFRKLDGSVSGLASKGPSPLDLGATCIVVPTPLRAVRMPGGPRAAVAALAEGAVAEAGSGGASAGSEAAAAAAYKYLGIDGEAFWPSAVSKGLQKAGDAVYHAYARKGGADDQVAFRTVHVIHVAEVGLARGAGLFGAEPGRGDAVASLAAALSSVFRAFAASEQVHLRLAPLATGPASGKFSGDLPQMHFEALQVSARASLFLFVRVINTETPRSSRGACVCVTSFVCLPPRTGCLWELGPRGAGVPRGRGREPLLLRGARLHFLRHGPRALLLLLLLLLLLRLLLLCLLVVGAAALRRGVSPAAARDGGRAGLGGGSRGLGGGEGGRRLAQGVWGGGGGAEERGGAGGSGARPRHGRPHQGAAARGASTARRARGTPPSRWQAGRVRGARGRGARHA